MPTCIDCGSTYADALVACPSCGKANPTAQPAQLLCPSCHKADQLIKIADVETGPVLQNTALLEKLSFPPKPVAPEINLPLTGLGVVLMLGSLFALIRIHNGSGPLFFAVCLILAVVCLAKARVNKKQAEAHIAEVKKWGDAKARWNLLYYCPACDLVFLPGQDASSPIERKAEYLPEAQ